MKKPSHISTRHRGFTIVELMVAIVIVAALAALIFALTSRALKKAKSMQCVQNLRDWSMVFNSSSTERNGRLYLPDNWAAVSGQPYNPTGDNQGASPFLRHWDLDLQTAMDIQFSKRGCPLIRDEAPDNNYGNPAATYRMNVNLREPRTASNRNPLPEVDLTRLKRASTKIIFMDGYMEGDLTLEQADLEKELVPAGEVHGNGKVHAVFADLHVEPINVSDLQNDWDRYVERADNN